MDTLDNMGWHGRQGRSDGSQGSFNLGALSAENWVRVQEQNDRTMRVIIGNPPYNANQQNESDNNRNREYPEIDRLISDTYIASSTAQKTKQYDMYKRFLRWASERLGGDGVIGFVSNNAFLDSRQDDGFRRVVAREFNELWVIDLKGNARTSGERRRRERGNIFGDKIRVGIAVYFLVRRRGAQGFRVLYNAVGDYLTSSEKLDYIKGKSLSQFDFSEITPDADGNWLNQSTSDFDSLLSLANRQTKYAKFVSEEHAIFRLYSLGVLTARDDWVYDFDRARLADKVRAMIEAYEDSRADYGGKKFNDAALRRDIKWTRDLKRQLRLNRINTFNETSIRATLYRPFVSKSLYYNRSLNEMQYQMSRIFPEGYEEDNAVICFLGSGARRSFSALAAARLPSYALFIDSTQCLPLYRYSSQGKRVSNITRWGIKRVNDHYKKAWGTGLCSQVPRSRHHRRTCLCLHLRHPPRPNVSQQVRYRPNAGVSAPPPLPRLRCVAAHGSGAP